MPRWRRRIGYAIGGVAIAAGLNIVAPEDISFTRWMVALLVIVLGTTIGEIVTMERRT